MRPIRFVALLIFGVIFFSPASFSFDEIGKFSDLDNKIIARDLDVMSFLLKLGDEVEAKKHIPLSDKAWAEDMADATIELLKRSYAEGPQEKTLIEKFRNFFKWDNLWAYTKDLGNNIKSFGRHRGLAAAVIVAVSGPSDIWFPVFATAIGRPELVPVMSMVPDSMILLSADNMIRNFHSQKRIEKAIGGKQAYKDFLAAKKKVLKDLGAKSDSYFHPLSIAGNEIETIMIAKKGIVGSIMSFFGVKHEGVSLTSVKKFLKENHLMDDIQIKSILAQSLPDEVMAGQLIYHLRLHRGEEMAYNVMARFHDEIRVFKLAPTHAPLWDSYQLLVKARTVAEIKEAIEHIPSVVSPRGLVQVWREKLLPEWSKNMENISIFEFRRMVKGFDTIFGNMLSADAPATFDESSKKMFLDYLENISPPGEKCNDALRTI